MFTKDELQNLHKLADSVKARDVKPGVIKAFGGMVEFYMDEHARVFIRLQSTAKGDLTISKAEALKDALAEATAYAHKWVSKWNGKSFNSYEETII